ncbi:hypothetical protein [Nocardioides sp. CER19]|uniref:hypothetical protein n=1 Tax=Nocardioides sp. CER19 TaxID=3038538 RepID=UPI002447550E|nr:hypothetical protein [Nocardioides sp. CER19]MDH2413702.1 hypothetical protein [Nocardioides sp. CER19]
MTPPYGPTLRQPDQTSCGAACVVVARLLASPDAEPTPQSFSREVLDTHRRLVGTVAPGGRAQLPWPSTLGTPPWAVAHALRPIEDVGYGTRLARWSPSAAFATAATAVAQHPVALYIGSSVMPRHVVLAVSAGPDGLSVYDPASGGLSTVGHHAFVSGKLGIAGWDVPWFVVLPR